MQHAFMRKGRLSKARKLQQIIEGEKYALEYHPPSRPSRQSDGNELVRLHARGPTWTPPSDQSPVWSLRKRSFCHLRCSWLLSWRCLHCHHCHSWVLALPFLVVQLRRPSPATEAKCATRRRQKAFIHHNTTRTRKFVEHQREEQIKSWI